MIYENEAQLLADAERLTAIWQPLLFLQEWRIKVVLKPLADNRAEVESHRSSMVADIRFNSDYWLDKQRGGLIVGDATEWDLEESVIHELLHLRLRDMQEAKEDQQENEENIFVSLMARTLKGLRHNETPFQEGALWMATGNGVKKVQ